MLGLGLALRPEMAALALVVLALALVLTVKGLALPFKGLKRQGQGKQLECHPPPAKKSCGLFSHYKSGAPSHRRVPAEVNPQQQLIDYIGKLTHPEFEEDNVHVHSVC